MKRVLLFGMIALALAASGQQVQTVTPEDFDGIEMTRSDTYSGQSLYGYIDGGADLYLEYGFQKLYVNEYKWRGEPLKAEIWVMDDAPSAYGIYALSHSDCLQWNMVSPFSCSSRYQVSAAKGPLFVSVTNTSGGPGAAGMCADLTKKILDKNQQEMWYMPALFQSAKLGDYKNSIRYFRGPLGVQNGIPVMADLLEDVEFDMYTITVTPQGPASLIGRIIFPDMGSRNTFLARAQLNPIDFSSDPVPVSNNMYRSWFKVSDTKILYMESQTGDANLKDYIPEIKLPDWLEF